METVKKGPCPPFDRLRASGLEGPSMPACGEPVGPSFDKLRMSGAQPGHGEAQYVRSW